MRRMRNGTVCRELNQASRDKGYTMRSVINPDAIRAFKRRDRERAAIIRDAIRSGDCSYLERVKDAWVLVAHVITMYEDGTIEWDYSTGGHFPR